MHDAERKTKFYFAVPVQDGMYRRIQNNMVPETLRLARDDSEELPEADRGFFEEVEVPPSDGKALELSFTSYLDDQNRC
jgi:hypothetical protein